LQPRSAWRVNLLTYARHPFFRSYGVRLHSSLGSVLSRPLVYSTYLPVSVCGTVTIYTRYEAFLGSVGSARLWPCGLPITSRCLNGLADLPTSPTYLLGPGIPGTRRCLPSCVPPSLITCTRRYRTINLFSIAYAFRPRLRDRLTLT
jgi:hypothetical protein